MCGIAGVIAVANGSAVPNAKSALSAMSGLIAHRGPDGSGLWMSSDGRVGLAHRRLAIIDLSPSAAQPMTGGNHTTITFNGEIYNYRELRSEFKADWEFRGESDTECILAAYEKHGDDCLSRLRGMFAFALWDDRRKRLFCARDHFGIKPFYYCQIGEILYFASEAKALVPFLPEIRTDKSALAEYLTFQYTIGENTLFAGIKQLLPGHALSVDRGVVKIWRYWDVNYQIDYDHSPGYFYTRLRELLEESVVLHGRSDVPVGAYVSGGVDSSLIYHLAQKNDSASGQGFHGRFVEYPGYDESRYAQAAVAMSGGRLHVLDVSSTDFKDHLGKIVYHLDFPVAGPGAFPQYMVSSLAARHVKVVLGGQGGDEIFGGYARYLIAYFEQCIKAAIDGQYKQGSYVVTIESIIPNLGLLREYKPLIKEFWRDGLFDPMDERYFRLINRTNDMRDEIAWGELDMKSVFEKFSQIFNNPLNVKKEAYFDKMTHFDFKCLLPALLQVEDRMSMAHGIESRVPFLDHPLVEFVATVPADVKFFGGNMKHLIKQVFCDQMPGEILNRRDKMGFPVPLKEWFDNELNGFLLETLRSMKEKKREFINVDAVMQSIGQSARFSRKIWGLLSLELWHQQFHDRSAEWKSLGASGYSEN